MLGLRSDDSISHLLLHFLEQACREQQFWCVNGAKIPNVDREKIFSFC
jgi:hypothetical protein